VRCPRELLWLLCPLPFFIVACGSSDGGDDAPTVELGGLDEDDVVIAESDDVRVVEGVAYFPLDAVDTQDLLGLLAAWGACP